MKRTRVLGREKNQRKCNHARAPHRFWTNYTVSYTLLLDPTPLDSPHRSAPYRTRQAATDIANDMGDGLISVGGVLVKGIGEVGKAYVRKSTYVAVCFECAVQLKQCGQIRVCCINAGATRVTHTSSLSPPLSLSLSFFYFDHSILTTRYAHVSSHVSAAVAAAGSAASNWAKAGYQVRTRLYGMHTHTHTHRARKNQYTQCRTFAVVFFY